MDEFLTSITVKNASVAEPTMITHNILPQEEAPSVFVCGKGDHQPSSSFTALSNDNNQNLVSTKYEDPLFTKQSLCFHYDQPTLTNYEVGDRNRLVTRRLRHKCQKYKTSSRNRKIKKDTNLKQNHVLKAKKRRTYDNRKLKKNSQHDQQNHVRRYQRNELLLSKRGKLRKQAIISKRKIVSKSNTRKYSTSKVLKHSHKNGSKVNHNRPALTTRSINHSNRQVPSDNIEYLTGLSTTNQIPHAISKPVNETKSTTSSVSTKHNSNVFQTYRQNDKIKENHEKSSKSKAKTKNLTKSKQKSRLDRKLTIRSPIHATFKKSIQHNRKRIVNHRNAKFPKSTSKTRIQIAPITTKDGLNSQTNNRIASSISRTDLSKNLSGTSIRMPLTKSKAQLTSKNNNDLEESSQSIGERLRKKIILPRRAVLKVQSVNNETIYESSNRRVLE